MKFLVTGGTGFVGKKLVAALLEKGHEVHLLTRNTEKITPIFGNSVNAYHWKPESEAAPKEAFVDVDAVIHLAGEGIADKRWTETQKKKIYDSRIIGTRHLVKTLSALKDLAPKTFVSASAIGFYGDRGNETLTETSSRGLGYLSNVCADWEKEAFLAPPQIRTTIIRIGIVLGREGGALKKLLPLFKLGAGGPVGDGKQWMSWIHVDDLVQLLIASATEEKYRGIVNAVTSEPVTNSDFSKALGRALHRPSFMPAPALALKLVMGELSVLVLASQKIIPDIALKNGFKFKYPTIDSALENIAKKKAVN